MRQAALDADLGGMEMVGIGTERAAGERHRLGVGVGDDDVAGGSDQRILAEEARIVPRAAGLPDLPVLLDHFARGAAERVHALLGGALQVAGIPEARIRLLHHVEMNRHVVVVEALAVMRDAAGAERLKHDREHFVVGVARLACMSLPNHSCSTSRTPRPTPGMKRPCDSWSIMQISWISRVG